MPGMVAETVAAVEAPVLLVAAAAVDAAVVERPTDSADSLGRGM